MQRLDDGQLDCPWAIERVQRRRTQDEDLKEHLLGRDGMVRSAKNGVETCRRTGEAHTATSRGDDLVAMHIPTVLDHSMAAASHQSMSTEQTHGDPKCGANSRRMLMSVTIIVTT